VWCSRHLAMFTRVLHKQRDFFFVCQSIDERSQYLMRDLMFGVILL